MTTVSLDGLPPTPEHDKLRAERALPREDVLADFIDYLGMLGVRFGKYPTPCDKYGEDGCDEEHPFDEGGDYVYHTDPDELRPVGGERVFSEWIAGFYDIDYKAFRAETEAVYQVVAAEARKSAEVD